ncbi:MAG: T9SS type A sorting domain-containing protein [Roseivirga sp.]|nr:T9SS type A sorting domain-containing protein [Roseivirga sp.]
MLRLNSAAVTTVVFLLLTMPSFGQTGISTITTSTVAGSSSSNAPVIPSDAGNSLIDDRGETMTINYGQGNNVKVSSYTVSGTVYDRFLVPDTLILNRATASDRLVNIWYTMNSSIVDNVPPTNDQAFLDSDEASDADAIYLTGNLNAGYDNILVNVDPAGGGIIEVETERVDVIWFSGIQTSVPGTAVFPVIERGGNDNIAIAAITSLNIDGTPAGYGTLIGIPENGWPGTGSSFNNYLVLRRESAGSTPLPLLPIGTDEGQSAQTIQGVAVSFTELGISANQSVFGYSIFSADIVSGYTTNTGQVVGSGSQTVKAGVDLTDISTFPTDTNSNDSGLDLVAGVSAAVASDDNLIETKGPGGYKSALSTWLKANVDADVTTSTDASTVTDWQDHWIGDHDATTGVAAPTYRSTSSAINFNPTVDFTSGSTSLTIANNSDFNTATSYTNKGINLAFRTSTTDVTDRQVLYEQGGNTRGIIVYIRSGNLHVSAYNRNNDGTGSPWNNGTNITTVSTSVSTNTEYIITLELAGASGVSGTLTAYLNGASFGTLSSVGLLFSDTDGIEFGGSDGSTQYDDGTNASTNSFEGEISEFIYCNEPGSFTTAQRDRIESYLAIKYGITLDQSTANDYVNSDGDIIFDATNNASLGGYLEYNNDIAGIGRDDAAELDQPASKSENTGSLVTMDRGATISTDDTWLIWGNDGGGLTETTGLTMPDTIDSRISRVWRVAETNEVLTTSVSFDLTGLGLSTDAHDFSLLIAANNSSADFSSATVVSGATINGSVITFTGVDLDDGQYFTLGTNYFECSPGGVETNLDLWLRADDGTSTTVDGADVATWTDKSTGGNDATAAGNQPNYAATSINYNPAVNFDQGNTEEITGTAGFHSVAYYMVVNPDNNLTSASTNEVLVGFGAPAGATDEFGAFAFGSVTGAFSGEVVTHAIGGTGTRWRRGISSTTISQINSGQTYLFGIRDNAVSATTTNMYVDGLEQADLNSGTFLTSVDQDYEVGSYTAANAFTTTGHFDGQIAELISYSVFPTDAEHNRIQSYLAVKYGITLDNSGGGTAGDYTSAGTTNIWDADVYSTYHNDVAGIGRDDASCLNQKQSKSENSGSIVAIGLGGIETNNAANANSFGADDTFMLWGNDGDFTNQANANTLDVPGNVTERMERIWRINETNTVGATTVQFDITGLGYSTTLSDFQLITSSTATMASGSVTPAASLVDNILTFTNVDFTDGDFFTIGTARTACGPAGVTTNLAMWLRADAGTNTTTDAADVTSWSDQSGNSNNVTGINQGGGAPVEPTYETAQINFNPSVQFTDQSSTDNAFLTTSSNPATGNMTLMAVYSTTQSDAGGAHYNSPAILGADHGTTGNNYALGMSSGRLHAKIGNGDGFGARDANTSNDGVPRIATATRVQAASGALELYLNSENVATSTSDNNALTDPDALGIGNHEAAATAAQFAGEIPEVLVFTSVLSADDRTKVETYLAIKYGITRSVADGDDVSTGSFDERDYRRADGTVIWDYDGQGSTYYNDIAGIGRDDDGCFTQKQSSSENSDDILTVGLGSVAASNSTNVNGFDDNGDYFVWGNDNGATAQASANTADIPSTISERMTRIWKVDDTGTVGATELQFDLTGLGYSVSDASAFSLLVGNTATMADATIVTGGTLNGNVLSFTGIDLTDGQFFTIGTGFVTCGPGGVNTNIALWLRADIEVFSDAGSTAAVDGNDVGQWNDQSSPADNGSESNLGGGGVIEPTYETGEINFNPVLRFTDPGSTNASYIETSTNTVSGDMTLISLFKTGQSDGSGTDFATSPALIGASETSGTLDYGMGMDDGTIWVNANTTATFDAETSSTFNDSQPHFVTATRTQSSGAITIYVDANSETTGTGSTSALSDPTSFGVGNHSDGDTDAQYAGDIAETIVFSSVLTSDERNRVESYLSLKYGLTMNAADDGGTGGVDERDYRAADGGVIWDYTGQTATYYNDIFGIGKDDLSCFEQTQSKSENSDALVTFNNNGSFSTDDSFLISGNDNAAIEEIENKERPATINSRLNREWRVQETGTVGSISLTYDMSTISGPLGTGTNNANLLRLMVDDDGDFSNGGTTLISPTSIDGTANTVTFSVDFTDGQYYTLGSTEEDALPITLISFDASVNDKNEVQLEWATAEEIGNSYFSIERSTDGVEFEIIGTREGAGNSNTVVEYSFTDIRPLNGEAFYRLRQTDFNGEFEHSEIKRVFVDNSAEIAFRVYPNPVNRGEIISVKQSSGSAEMPSFSYQVLTLNGKVVRSGKSENAQGTVGIQTAGLGSGIYLLKVKSEGLPPRTIKFIIN